MYKLLFVLFLLPVLASAQTVEDVRPLTIGETFTVQSKILGEARRINVYLPTYYPYDSLKNHPVLYLLDGSLDEDFIHISGLVQFCSFSWINDLPETIVVGIGNVDRQRDFTFPTQNRQDLEEFPSSGGSAKFIDFLDRELPAVINERYRTNDTTTLLGQSLGGLLATEILFNRPEMFDNYVIVSPSLWWGDQSLLRQVPPPAVARKGVFVGVGAEGKVMEQDARALYELLSTHSGPESQVHFGYFPARDHGDTLHEAAYAAFQRLFGKD